MSNLINISRCDNELYIIAIGGAPGFSYQLCHVLSGGNNLVDVTANLSKGEYAQPITYNGATKPLQETYNVSLPKGTYSILAVGIDWGGGTQANFSITSNGATEEFGTGQYNPGPTVTPSVFWTNKGEVLKEITIS